MTDMKIRPPAADLFYVTIDGTSAIDSVTFGQLWQGLQWKNLLFDFKPDPADADRRVDAAHPTLPIKFMSEARKLAGAKFFSDVCIMPEGVDGTGLDAGNWPDKISPAGNATQMAAANKFIESFVLAPRADATAQKLGTGSRFADLVYVSSHGVRTGDMMGDTSYHHSGSNPFFIPAHAAAAGAKLEGVKWLVLSNCNTVVRETHVDWLKLMQASPGFRGILGYQGVSAAADASAGADATFVKLLQAGLTLKAAWREANTRHGMQNKWVVLCHDAAKDDDIQKWNDGKLPPVSLSPLKVSLFDEAHLSGVAAVAIVDPFTVFWSKTIAGTTTKITPANRYDAANKLSNGDDLTITVTAPGGAAFVAGTVIEITLVYVREDFGEALDVSTMFSETGVSGIKSPVAFTTVVPDQKKNTDTWKMTVDGTPSTVSLSIKAKNVGFSSHNLPFWLKGKITPPSGPGVPRFDFIHDAAIYSK
jgi:hypothetical protein